MIPCLAPPPAQAAPAPLPLEAAALDFCRVVATKMRWESKTDPVQMRALKSQARPLMALCVKALPAENRALPLLEAALGSLESATGEEAKGEKRFGRAAKLMALRWRSVQKAWGAGNPKRLPELEDLALLYELAGLRASPWRDESLRIRVGVSKVPDPKLEQELVAAVEDHYGPWLTVVELEPMLEFCGHLARIWMAYPEDRELTRQVLKHGLKPDAYRVWKLAARKAPEGLERDLASLLARLDPEILLRVAPQEQRFEGDVHSFLGLAEALRGTSLEGSIQDLLKRLDTRIWETNPGSRRGLRRRIARLREDWTGWAGLLGEELAEARPFEELSSLLGEAEAFLWEHPENRLLDAGTQRLKVAVQAKRSVSPELSQRLEAWAALQVAAGHAAEAEELIRLRLALEDPRGQDLPARCGLLARLARWKELGDVLGPAQENERENVLGWRFRAALGRGESGEAKRWVDAWLARITGPEAPVEAPSLPGLSWAIPAVQARTELLGQLVGRYGAVLMPGQEALLGREPWRILAALDPEAPGSLVPAKTEEALRWRWSRLPAGESRARLLEQLIKDAEGELGSSHLLVAELLLDLGLLQKEEGMDSLARAQRILESTSGCEEYLAKVHLAMAAACSLMDGPGLERNLLKVMEILERTPRLNGEIEASTREMPLLLLIHLWREQRLDDLVTLGPRVQALAQRGPKPSGDAAEVGDALVTLARVARLQGQLRAAGLP